MWYYLVKYSFDADKTVFGPFETYDDAWEAALEDAQKEFDIDQNENEWDADMSEYEEYGEIVLVNHFTDRDDTTEWIVFELDNTKLM
jgi:hypothetical protein